MRIVTLLTDFGDESPYPGQVRAVIAAPTFGEPVTVIDLTHRVRRHDVRQGAYLLWAACRAFPPGTVHLAVVDPGVGTPRRPIAVSSGGMLFVGPDNGLLLLAARTLGTPEVREIRHRDLRRVHVSATFHGRDLFAPTARWLALGFPFQEVGPVVPDPVELPFTPPRRGPEGLSGEVVAVDPFGNLATNLPGEWLDSLPSEVEVHVAGRRERARRVRTYGDGEPGSLVVLVGSDGHIEIAVREGSAFERLGAAPSTPIGITPPGNSGRSSRALVRS